MQAEMNENSAAATCTNWKSHMVSCCHIFFILNYIILYNHLDFHSVSVYSKELLTGHEVKDGWVLAKACFHLRVLIYGCGIFLHSHAVLSTWLLTL